MRLLYSPDVPSSAFHMPALPIIALPCADNCSQQPSWSRQSTLTGQQEDLGFTETLSQQAGALYWPLGKIAIAREPWACRRPRGQLDLNNGHPPHSAVLGRREALRRGEDGARGRPAGGPAHPGA